MHATMPTHIYIYVVIIIIVISKVESNSTREERKEFSQDGFCRREFSQDGFCRRGLSRVCVKGTRPSALGMSDPVMEFPGILETQEFPIILKLLGEGGIEDEGDECGKYCSWSPNPTDLYF